MVRSPLSGIGPRRWKTARRDRADGRVRRILRTEDTHAKRGPGDRRAYLSRLAVACQACRSEYRRVLRAPNDREDCHVRGRSRYARSLVLVSSLISLQASLRPSMQIPVPRYTGMLR